MNRRLAYAQLLRIPNVFTAASDVAIGLLFTQAPLAFWVCITTASACLYSAGMAWNDYFDRSVDALERPCRPIPSGRISPKRALGLAVLLSAAGLAAAALSRWSLQDQSFQPIFVAAGLLAWILAYDVWLKKTPVGPLAMGACRFFNVRLGFSTAPFSTFSWLTAAIVGTYIVGVTVIAKDEAQQSRRGRLLIGTAIVGIALVASLAVPLLSDAAGRAWMIPPAVLLGATLSFVIAKAIGQATPQNVQALVKSAVLGVVLLDTALATSLVGPVGLTLLLLLIPARMLGRWVYST